MDSNGTVTAVANGMGTVTASTGPLSGIGVGDNKILIPNFTLLGGCTAPFVNALHTTGAIFTILSSKWQTWSDATAEWSDIEGTENTFGQMCAYGTRTPGEYRLAMDVSP